MGEKEIRRWKGGGSRSDGLAHSSVLRTGHSLNTSRRSLFTAHYSVTILPNVQLNNNWHDHGSQTTGAIVLSPDSIHVALPLLLHRIHRHERAALAINMCTSLLRRSAFMHCSYAPRNCAMTHSVDTVTLDAKTDIGGLPHEPKE